MSGAFFLCLVLQEMCLQMIDPEIFEEFRIRIDQVVASGAFVKASLGNYHGIEPELKKIYIRPVLIKGHKMLAFTYRYKTRDIFKNFFVDEGIALLEQFVVSGFRICTVLSTSGEFVLEVNKKGKVSLRESQTDLTRQVSLSHDRFKKRLIESGPNQLYLTQLGLTDKSGKVLKSGQDKYRQINRYIEILDSLVCSVPSGSIKHVCDMGSGKGYLTFALYDYLINVRKLDVSVTGVEYRADLVALCNNIAEKASFDKLRFVKGTIAEFSSDSVDLLIALHACDTATDDAIIKGIRCGAQLVVVAPCCHKQVRRQMEKVKVRNHLSPLTRHGVFMDRQSEMLTDAIRVLILEYFGYRVKVIEFISDVHTPKNVLIAGVKGNVSVARKAAILEDLTALKRYFGITEHYLERAFLQQ